MYEHADLVDSFAGMKVLIVGDAILDRYLSGAAIRLSQEAPVPVVGVDGIRQYPGGAANSAVNAAALGARTSLLGPIGPDPYGSALQELLAQGEVQLLPGSVREHRQTLSKTRIIVDGQMLARLDEGTTTWDTAWERTAIAALEQAWQDVSVVIVSDYNYGALSPSIIDGVRRLQATSPRVLGVDAKNFEAYREAKPTVVKPNYSQAMGILRGSPRPSGGGRTATVTAAASRLLEATGAKIAAVTLDSDGSVILQDGHEPYRTFVRSADPTRTIGAGDSYLAAFAMALGANASLETAADFATMVAQEVVGQDGTATCHSLELKRKAAGTDSLSSLQEAAVEQCRSARERGKRIVFTNGVFDILHPGHVRYLEQASSLGDVLVVAINSDESVRRIKGPSRPVNALADRMSVVAALDCVDHVVAFSDNTPERLIRAICPDVFVKGGDYTRDQLPEAPLVEELGGAVVILDHVADRSTTNIIERIRSVPATRMNATKNAGVPGDPHSAEVVARQ